MNLPWSQWAECPRWQQTAGLCLLALSLLLLMVLMLWRPLWQAQAQAQRQQSPLEAEYQTLRAQSQRQAPWQAHLPLAEAALTQQQQRLPTHASTDLSAPLHQLISAHQITLNHARPLPNEALDGLTAYAYDLSGSGTTDAVLALLHQLATHPDLLIISRLTLNQMPSDGTPVLHFEAQLHTLRPTPTDENIHHDPT
ncbi:MAG: hypothetical protein KA214_04200 [Neisseriaceae bacterium]|nr:hypothetical protein [Neisseriaceae bacterium]